MDQDAIDKVVAELRAKFPEGAYDLVSLDIRAGLFVLRNPAHNEHMLYKKMILDESQQAIASHNLFVATCVYPEPSLVQAALKRFPVRLTRLARGLQGGPAGFMDDTGRPRGKTLRRHRALHPRV